jgi:hypothetical protein
MTRQASTQAAIEVALAAHLAKSVARADTVLDHTEVLSPMMRHIILHHHIFKNAGTTLDFSLQRQFGNDFSTLDDPAGQIIDVDMLYDFLTRHPGVKAVSSHHFCGQPFTRRERFRFFDFGFVRHPLPRLSSIYKFSQRSEAGKLAIIAKRTGPQEFMRLLIGRYPYMIDSPQVNLFANQGFYGRATSDDDLRRACARFESFALCGPVERYDEAMVTLEYINSPVYGPTGLDLAYVRQNVSPSLEGDQNLAEFFGAANYDWIMAMSARDEQLWEFANRELDRRIRAVPDFEERLVAFRLRCQQLGAIKQEMPN